MKTFKNLIITALFTGILLALNLQTVQAQASEPYAGEPLCLPGVYQSPQSNCLVMGPAQKLTELAQKGITLPFKPIPGYAPDPAFSIYPVPYLTVGEQAIPVYATLNDARARNPARYIEAGFKFLAVYNRVDEDNGIYYQLTDGLWIEAGEASTECCIRYGRTNGLLFNQNPETAFGWSLDTIDILKAPGYKAPKTGKQLNREDMVIIYDLTNVDGVDWFMIGVDQWVERRKVRRFELNNTPPEGVDNNRWIEINLLEQTLSIYENNQLVFAVLIATGLDPFFTKPGLFQVYKKVEIEAMSGSFEVDRSDYYYLDDVPWAVYYDEARAIHGTYWHTYFGYPQSHGCVNLTIGDAKVVYDWVNVGDWVYVWDPSGATPTDPEFYTTGGA